MRKIIYIILAFIFFLGAVTFYVNRVLIPQRLKTVITHSTEKYLGRKVTLKKIRFNPLRGFIADGVTIYEKDSDDMFATIKEATVGLRYIPLILNRRIVVASFEVHHISAHLIHYAADQWNFSDIVERVSQPKSTSSKSVPVYLSRAEMSDGRLKVTDLEDGAQSSEFFNEANLKASFSLSRGIMFQLGTAIPQQKGWLEAKGRYQLIKKTFKGQIKMKNIPIAQYVKLTRQELPLTLNNLYVNDANAAMTWAPERVDAQGWGNVRDVDIEWAPGQTVKADAFVLQKGDFSMANGQLSASGHSWSKGLKISDGIRSYIADNIDAELTGLSIQDNTFYAAGKAVLQHASVSAAGAPSFAGDLALNDIHVSQSQETWTVSARVEAPQSVIVFSPEAKLTGNLSSPLLSVVTNLKTVTVRGTIDSPDLFLQWPPGKELRGAVTFQNISATGASDTPWTAEGQVIGRGISIKLPNDRTFSTDMTASASVKMQTQPSRKVDVKSDFQLRQSTFGLKSGLVFHGDPAGQLEVHSSDKPNTPAAYEGSFKLDNAAIENTHIGTIDGIKGDITFRNNFASSSDLSFNTLGMAGRLKGKVQEFDKPTADAKIHVDKFDLTQAGKIATRFFTDNQLTLEGTGTDIDISYKGPINDASGADVRFDGDLEDASAVCGKLNQSASKLSGRIDYRKDYFAWKNLKAFYHDRNYVLTGKLTNFKKPLIETSIASRNLKMTTHFEYSPDVTTIKKLTGVLEHMVFDLKGSSRPSGDGRPMLDLSGDLDIDLKYLPFLLPSWDVALKPHQIDGNLKVRGEFHGDPVHWQDWRYNLTGGSGQFSFWGMKIRNMKFNAVQKDNRIKPLHVWGNYYGGEFNTIASVDLAKKDLPFDLIVKLENADIGLLKNDTPLKKYNIDGKLSSTALFEGNVTDLGNLKGKGGVQIKDGKLWELDLLKGLGGIMLIPEYKNIIFNEAGMNFTVNEGLLLTENLQLLSKSLTLYGRGNLNFKTQGLNLILSPDFNNDVIAESSSLKKGSTAIIAQSEKFITVDITGSLSHPQYKVNKSPGRILQKTGGIILENVSGFFKNIF